MTAHFKAVVGGSKESLIFEQPKYEMHDTIFELDAKQELISVMKTEFLLTMMKKFGFDFADINETEKVLGFISFLEKEAGLNLEWSTLIEIDHKEYDYINKKFK